MYPTGRRSNPSGSSPSSSKKEGSTLTNPVCSHRPGFPYPADDPSIHFCLSHSGSLAVCGVSGHPVGVDAEPVQKAVPEVAAMCFLPDEQEWMKASDDPDRAFTRLWTWKESFLKLSGEGMSRSPDSFCALPGKDAPEGVRFSESEVQGHLICVCTQQKDAVVFSRWRVLQP